MTSQQNKLRKGNRFRRAVVAGAVALTISAGGATAWALDRFVVQHVEISDVSAYEASQAGTSAGTTAGTSASTTADTPSTSAVTADTSYVSDSSNISISTVYTGGTATVSAGLGEGSLDGATDQGTVTAGEYTAEQCPGAGGGPRW
ncbi:MAG: exopolysaccharide biosynthesis protein [Pseudarthrobacter sp.]|nr:exopolysaccharide biosynthesis protein [Pseudarthrobacter sp.]